LTFGNCSYKVWPMEKEQPPQKILLVDDEKMIRDLLETILVDAGYDVRQASTGIEALELLDSFLPNVILLDYMMPELSGLEVLQRIQLRGLRIPCIIITGKGSEEIAVTLLKEGAFDYLTKPFRTDELLKVVANAIEIGRINPDNFQYTRQELLFLRKENAFLKQQLVFMDRVLQVAKDGDAALEGLNKRLSQMQIRRIFSSPELLEQNLQQLNQEPLEPSNVEKSPETLDEKV
jgi:DNA-binding response OmpR family regulator